MATFRGLRGEPLRIRLSPKRAPLHGSERYVSEAVAATLAATDCCPQLGPCQVGHVSISLITFRTTAEPSASCRAHRPIACFSGLPSGRLERRSDRIERLTGDSAATHPTRQCTEDACVGACCRLVVGLGPRIATGSCWFARPRPADVWGAKLVFGGDSS